MRLAQTLNLDGHFWLPGQDHNKIYGTLKIENSGNISLEIRGNLDDDPENIRLGRVNGRVLGRDVTLENCFYKQKNPPVDISTKSLVIVNKAYLGQAFAKDDEVTLNALDFEVDCLEEWLGLLDFEFNKDIQNQTISIRYQKPQEIQLSLPTEWGFKVSFITVVEYSSETLEAKITRKTFIRLESDFPKPSVEFTACAYKIVEFLCFAMDATVSLKNLIGYLDSNAIKIFYKSKPFQKTLPSKSYRNMLFNFRGIGQKKAELALANWIKAYSVFEPAIALYFSAKTDVHKYHDGKFLALIQGLETLHRSTSKETIMDPEKYKKLRQEIFSKVSRDEKSWLKQKLGFANELTLRDRLRRLTASFEYLLGKAEVTEVILGKIVNSRNYLTHYDSHLIDKAAQPTEYYWLCGRLEILFELSFLNVIGFSREDIQRIVSNNYQFRKKIEEFSKVNIGDSRL